MRSRSVAFAQAQTNAGKVALPICVMWTALGCRIYSAIGLSDSEAWEGSALLLDGTWLLDGNETFWPGNPVIANEPRVLSFGRIRESGGLLPIVGLATSRAREISGIEIRLRNDDDHFGRALGQDVFLSAKLSLPLNWRGQNRYEAMTRFQGIIQEHSLSREEFIVRAEAA